MHKSAPRFGAPPIGKGCVACPAPKSVFFGQIGVRRWTFHPIPFTKPLQQIAVFAPFAAKGLMFLRFYIAAQWAFFVFRDGHEHGHSRSGWNRNAG